MPSPEEDAERLADQFVSTPLEALAEALGHEDQEVGLADVHDSVASYDEQERLLTEMGEGVPCVEVSGDYPIPIALFPGYAFAGESYLAHQYVRAALQRTTRSRYGDAAVEPYAPEKARWFLRNRLAAFLVPRLRKPAEAKPTPVSNITNFTVETRGRQGLRIHYTPAYFVQSTLPFGATLSTPVDSVLRPGTYMFGALVSGQVQWDTTATYTVPGQPTVAYLP